MLEIDAGKFITSYVLVANFSQFLVNHDRLRLQGLNKWPGLPESDIKLHVLEPCKSIGDIAQKLDLSATVTLAEELLDVVGKIRANPNGIVEVRDVDFHHLNGAAARFTDGVKAEMRGKWFLALPARGMLLWSPKTALFGQQAFVAFPSAHEDIEEAAKCLAVDRGTACVMHLMRATEVPLKALGKMLGTGSQNDWGAYIREIDKELANRLKLSGKRTPDEAFYAETSQAFDRVKRAWRNSTMHVDQTYTPERATEIFESTKSFMAYLATRISE